jgi:hypothetical protein
VESHGNYIDFSETSHTIFLRVKLNDWSTTNWQTFAAIRATGVGDQQFIVSRPSTNIQFQWYAGGQKTVTTAGTGSLTGWQTVIAKADLENEESRIWVPGFDDNSQAFPGTYNLQSLSGPIRIGEFQNGFRLDGLIGCFYIWRTLKSDEFLLELHENPLLGFELDDQLIGHTSAGGFTPDNQQQGPGDPFGWAMALFCKSTGGPIGAPPTISIDQIPAVSEPPIGSEVSFTGNWQDTDNTSNVTISIWIDGFDRTSTGTLDDGDTSSTAQQAWSWSTSNLTFADDRKQLEVRITDDDSNVTSAFSTIEINYNDLLRAMWAHPVPYTPDGDWEQTTGDQDFQPDNPNSGSTWATALTGFDGGRIIDEATHTWEMTAPSNGTLTVKISVHLLDADITFDYEIWLDNVLDQSGSANGPNQPAFSDDLQFTLTAAGITAGQKVEIKLYASDALNPVAIPDNRAPFLAMLDAKFA